MILHKYLTFKIFKIVGLLKILIKKYVLNLFEEKNLVSSKKEFPLSFVKKIFIDS